MNSYSEKDVQALIDETEFDDEICKQALRKCSCYEAALQYLLVKRVGSKISSYRDGKLQEYSDLEYVEYAERLAKNKTVVWCNYCKKNVKDTAPDDGHIIYSCSSGSFPTDGGKGYWYSDSWVQLCPENPAHRGIALI